MSAVRDSHNIADEKQMHLALVASSLSHLKHETLPQYAVLVGLSTLCKLL